MPEAQLAIVPVTGHRARTGEQLTRSNDALAGVRRDHPWAAEREHGQRQRLVGGVFVEHRVGSSAAITE